MVIGPSLSEIDDNKVPVQRLTPRQKEQLWAGLWGVPFPTRQLPVPSSEAENETDPSPLLPVQFKRYLPFRMETSQTREVQPDAPELGHFFVFLSC